MKPKRFRPGRGRPQGRSDNRPQRYRDRNRENRPRAPERDRPDFWSRLLGSGQDNDFLEKTPCPACGNLPGRVLSRVGPTLLRQCRACGQVYISPRLSENVRDALQRQNASPFTSERNIGLRHLMAERLQRMHREMPPLEGLAKGSASLLEVGSAWGHFLQLCRPHYGSVEGIELSRDQAAEARERFDLNVASIDVLRDPWAGKHHIIVAWDWIEKSPQPLLFLQWAHEHLLPGGQLILSTPNYDGLFRQLLGSHWFHFAVGRNLCYFTPASLKALLKQAGFHDVSIRTSGRSWLSERWNRHNRVDRGGEPLEQWLQALRVHEEFERQRETSAMAGLKKWKRLWRAAAGVLINLLMERGLGDEMRVYARKA